MRRYKLVFNVDIEDTAPIMYPCGGDYTHLTFIQGVARRMLNAEYNGNVRTTLDKIIDKSDDSLVTQVQEIMKNRGATEIIQSILDQYSMSIEAQMNAFADKNNCDYTEMSEEDQEKFERYMQEFRREWGK